MATGTPLENTHEMDYNDEYDDYDDYCHWGDTLQTHQGYINDSELNDPELNDPDHNYPVATHCSDDQYDQCGQDDQCGQYDQDDQDVRDQPQKECKLTIDGTWLMEYDIAPNFGELDDLMYQLLDRIFTRCGKKWTDQMSLKLQHVMACCHNDPAKIQLIEKIIPIIATLHGPCKSASRMTKMKENMILVNSLMEWLLSKMYIERINENMVIPEKYTMFVVATVS